MKRHTLICSRAPRLFPVALAVATLAAHAQSQPPAGSPSDVRYTHPVSADAALHPRAPGVDAHKPTLFRGEQAGVDYAVNGAVSRIVVEADRDAVPADGQAAVKFKVMLTGRDGKPLTQAVFITIEHSGGRLLLPQARTDEAGAWGIDADRVTPGVQMKVQGGVAEFSLLAPAEAQDVRLRISAGGEEASGVVSFVPDLRPMLAAGLIEGIVNFRSKTLLTSPRRNDGFEQELQTWSRDFSNGRGNAAGRAAMFFKGMVSGDMLLTAAYDSDKDTRARLLRDVRSEELYPVYGDASLRSFDARSAQRLYVRIDKNKSYALYGDFVTGDGFTQAIGQGAVASLKQRSLGNYNRTATGLRLHHEEGALTGNVFVIRDSLRQVVEEINSQGSGPYGLRNNGVLEGSEKVEVITRDRTQPSRIVSVRAMVRLVDYSFEPFSGRILLNSFLPGVDDNLNPISLRVSYEVDQGGDSFWVAGADGQVRVHEAVDLGGAVVSDRNPLARYDLVSGNLTFKIAPRTALVVEGAQSTSTVNTNPSNQASTPALQNRSGEVQGKAVRVELVHEDERTDARLFYGKSSPLFNNLAAPLAGGREEVFAKGGWKIVPDLQVTADALQSTDRNTNGGQRTQAGLGLLWNATERLNLQAGLRSAKETVGAPSNGALSWPYQSTLGNSSSLGSGAGGGALGFGNQVLDPATGLPVIQNSSLPTGTNTGTRLPTGSRLSSEMLRLGAGYRVSDRFSLGAEAEADVSGDQRRRVSLGGDYTVAERTRLYGRFERQSGWVNLGGASDSGSSANSVAVGVDSSYLRDTQLFSEYRLRDAISGRDVQQASGVRNTWHVAEGWRVNAAVENMRVVSGTAASVQAISTGIDWTAHALWRASSKLEWRRSGDISSTPDNDSFNTTLWQTLVARKLDRDWTVLARNHLLKTDYVARGDVLQDRAQLGLAYRDTDTNVVNGLGKVEYKTERDASSAAVGELRSRAVIVSAVADVHPSRPWWGTARVAAKWQNDQLEGGVLSSFRAQLLAGRLVYDFSKRWDFSVLAAVQTGSQGARQTAYGAEVGYLLQTNLWLSAGVNASGFTGDADLAGNEYTRRGVYLRLRFKFDENLFKGGDREVNRSMDR
jgi:hypothetical protein